MFFFEIQIGNFKFGKFHAHVDFGVTLNLVIEVINFFLEKFHLFLLLLNNVITLFQIFQRYFVRIYFYYIALVVFVRFKESDCSLQLLFQGLITLKIRIWVNFKLLSKGFFFLEKSPVNFLYQLLSLFRKFINCLFI